jgi:Right handed beta helix region
VLVRGGSYPGLVVENDRRRSSHVTLRRYRSAWVRLDGISLTNSTYLRFRGFRITDWVNFNDGTQHVGLLRNNISPHGVRLKAVNGITIGRNRIHDLAPTTTDKCGCAVWGQSWGENGVRNVRVRGNVITNIASDGVHFGNGRNVAIVNNVIARALNRGDGEHVDSIQIIRASPLVIRGNRLQNNQHGIMFTNLASNGVVIENNVVAQIRSYGINAGDIPHARIVNNTFWRNRYGAIILRDDPRDDPTPVGVVFRNNIVDAQNSGDGWFASHDYNLIAAGSRYGPHDRRGSARFIRPLRGNFRLAAGSRGIDAGTSVGAPRRDRFGRARRDIAGIRNTGGGTRRYYDIGAHER